MEFRVQFKHSKDKSKTVLMTCVWFYMFTTMIMFYLKLI